jgi:hypothetical protein
VATIDLNQTEAAASCSYNKFCYGGSDSTGTKAASDCRAGGTYVSGTAAITVPQTETSRSALLFVSTAIGETTWASGTHTVRLNVTTAAASNDLTLEEIHVCRVNASCSNVESLGSLTAINQAMDSTGVKTHNVTGVSASSANPSTPTTDKLAYVLVFSNAHMHAARGITYTPDQTINTPIVSTAAQTASGTPSITIPTASGQAKRFLDATNGTPVVPSVTAAGTAKKLLDAVDGAPSIVVPTASGQAKKLLDAVDGAPSTPVITASGTALQIRKASGALTIPAITASGTAARYVTASGTPTAPLPTASGTAKRLLDAVDGAPSIPLPVAAGTAAVAGAQTASGTPVMPMVTAAGQAKKFLDAIDGTPATSLPVVTGQATRILKPSGTPTMPLPTASGGAVRTVNASGKPTMPLLTASGTAERPFRRAIGAPSIGLPTASGTATVKKTASGALQIPAIQADGTGLTETVDAGSVWAAMQHYVRRRIWAAKK